MACAAVPLCWRVLYGFLDREGPRLSEAARLTFADLDLERGVIMLDENKTDDACAWARTAVELGLGELHPLDEAIPELAAAGGGKGAGKGGDTAATPSAMPGRPSRKRLESLGKKSTESAARSPLPATASGSSACR